MLTLTLLAATLTCFALKLAGWLVPARALDHPVIQRTVNLLTVALLGGLVAVQTAAVGQRLALDARAAALLTALVLLWRRAPFIVVVIAAAGTAAGLRALGWA